MVESTVVTEAGRVAIPESLREKCDLAPGDEVRWEDTADGLMLRPHETHSGRGLLVPDDLSPEERSAVFDELAFRLRARRERDDEY
ncbi:MAG: AbrB/MazE/SpoVT family DNA-binding domain-containing protein [Halobacteriaceae archaeon]